MRYSLFPVAKEEAKKLVSGPATPSKQVITSQESTGTPSDTSRHAHVTDVANDVLRMQRVKERLDSVLVTVFFLPCNFSCEGDVVFSALSLKPASR